MRILLVEDDSSLGETIKEWLKLDGYAVDWVNRGDTAKAALLGQDYDCILLDRGLPGISGDQLLAYLREKKRTLPVLMITAQDSIADKIEGLDLGADDYLVKPFDLEELSARIRASIRRSSGIVDQLLVFDDITLNPATKLVEKSGNSVVLTAKEYTILQALLLNPSQVITRSQLEDKLYSWGDEIESNAVEVHIHHLRKKLGSKFIKTIRNHGYTLIHQEA